MGFARLKGSLEMHAVIGAEVTLEGGYHLTWLVKNRQGCGNLCQLTAAAHNSGERHERGLGPSLLPGHAGGLIALSGCSRGELTRMPGKADYPAAREPVKKYLNRSGQDNHCLELQQNPAAGDTERNKELLRLTREPGLRAVATGNVHYHARERRQLQDCPAAIKNCRSPGRDLPERRPNSEFCLRPLREAVSQTGGNSV